MSSSIPTPSPKPALKPPPGVIPNFVNPPSQAYVTVVVLAICLAITTPVVLLRIYVRHFINRRLWWDDCKLSTHALMIGPDLTTSRLMYHCLGARISSRATGEWVGGAMPLTSCQIGLFGFAGLLFETLKYGNGVDMWNVTAAHGAHFIKVRERPWRFACIPYSVLNLDGSSSAIWRLSLASPSSSPSSPSCCCFFVSSNRLRHKRM